MPDNIYSSERFKPEKTRRDFLGLAAVWSAITAFVVALLGAMRLPMPSVFPESNSQIKLGSPKDFIVGSSTYFPQQRLWVYRTEEGFFALSSVCTHLGCIAERQTDNTFFCPCHGSAFSELGDVVGGPAPKGLTWVALSISPEGQLVADTLKEVDTGAIFKV